MQTGQFYFISDDFFLKFDPEKLLMGNKDGQHRRPCFYAFRDRQLSYIYWCIPISSRTEKFEDIVRKKLQRQVDRGVQQPKCNTIRFGNVMGQRRAFLIQNMFPITEDYISALYIDRNTQKPVTVDSNTAKDIYLNAKNVLKLVMRGYRDLVFPDIMTMKQQLSVEHEQQRNRSTERDELSMDSIMSKLNPVEKKQEQEHTRDEEDWSY